MAVATEARLDDKFIFPDPRLLKFLAKQEMVCENCKQKRGEHKIAGGGQWSFSEVLVCPTSVFKESSVVNGPGH